MNERVRMGMAFLVFLSVCGLFASCLGGKDKVQLKNVCGTLDSPLAEDSIPDHVKQAMDNAVKFHQHEIMNDVKNEVSVWSIDEVDESSTEGFGIVVVKGAKSTSFPQIRNVRQPKARYDSSTCDLWLATSAMEGTGVQVERLYQMQFQEDGQASIVSTIDPYDIQQALCQRLAYTVEGENIFLFIDQQPIDSLTNTVSDMGGFDDDALWIGEQISYDLSLPQPRVVIVPGVKFVTGLVLHYDDSPAFIATFTRDEKGTLTLSDIKVKKETTYFPAIDRYFVNEIGKSYAEAEYYVPFHTIVGVDERDPEDIKVWGDFWVINYNQVGDTLKAVSGGSHPGMLHIRQTDIGYEVTAFDQVEDGSRFLPSAKRIFGDKYEAFHAINSDEQKREKVRAEALANYVKTHNLSVTMYQDFGWPAKKIVIE